MALSRNPTRKHMMNEVKLAARQLWRESGDHRGQVVTCLHGIVWLTHEGMPGDHVLRPGQKFVVTRRGLLLAQGLRDATLQIADPTLPNSDTVRSSLN